MSISKPHTRLPAKLQQERLSVVQFSATELPDDYIDQLVAKSRQPHIQEFEGPEDVGTAQNPGRFRSVADYKAWAHNKHRLLFLLINQQNLLGHFGTPDIASVSWFGYRTHPKAPGRTITFAMRCYEADATQGWAQYCGKGLAVPMMKHAHNEARSTFTGHKLWLDLVADNEASRAMCLRAGYTELTRFYDTDHSGQERIVMINDTAFEQDISVDPHQHN